MYEKPTYEELQVRLHVLEMVEKQFRQSDEKMRHVNAVLLAISDFNHLISSENDRSSIAYQACNLLTHAHAYSSAWIGLVDSAQRIDVIGEAGIGQKFRLLQAQINQEKWPECFNLSMGQSDIVVIPHPTQNCVDCPISNALCGKAAMAGRLRHGGKNYGVLVVTLPSTMIEDSEELSLFRRVLANIGFAIHAVETAQERTRTEAALRESEERFRAAVDNSPEAIFIQTNRCFAYLNPKAVSLFGAIDKQQLLGRPVVDRFHPDFHAIVAERIRRLNEDRQMLGWLEQKVLRCDGTERDVEFSGVPFTYLGKPGALVFGRDITERKRAEKELQMSEQRYRRFVETANEGVWAMDGNFQTTFVNRRMAEMLGFKAEEMIGKRVDSFMFEEDLADHQSKMSMRTQGRDGVYERRFRHKNGQEVWTQVSATSILDDQGRFGGSHAFFTDMTERKRMETAIRESEVNLKSFLNAIPESAFMMDPDGILLALNNTAADRLGKSPEEMLGRTIYDFIPVSVGIFRKTAVEEVIRTKKPFSFEDLRMGRAIYNNINPVLNSEGDVTRLAIVGVDITDLKQAEAALCESEKRLRALLDSMADWVWEVDAQGKYLHCSERVKDILGYTPEEMIGKTPFEFMEPDEGEKIRHHFKKTLFLKRPVRNLENWNIHKDGRKICLLTNGVPILGVDGELNGYVGVDTDITERRMIEDRLRDSETRLRLALEAANAGSWEWDVPTGQNTWSENLWKLYGLAPHTCEASYATWLQAVHPEDRERVERQVREAVEMGREIVIEWRSKGLNNAERWLMSRGKPLKDINDKMNRYTGIVIDITERKQAEDALRENRAKLDAALSSMTDAVFISDEKGYFVDFNEAFASFHRFSNKDMCLKTLSEYPDILDVFFQNGEKAPLDQWAVPRALRGETVVNAEYSLRRKDTGEAWVGSYSFGPIRDKNGAIVGSVVVGRDITEQKKASEKQAELESQLIQAQKMESVGRLAGGVAHDFNNMLSIIIGFAEMAIDLLEPSNPTCEVIQEIISAGQRANQVVRQLLAFARKQTIAPEVLDLNDAVEGILKMLRRLIGEDIDLVWKPTHEPCLVKMDPSQIDQLLANLVVNARDAIADVGEITIGTGSIAFDEEYCTANPGLKLGDYVMLSVSDNGSGIEKQTLGYIFEPFFTTKEMGKGTGLGLATVYGIVKQNEGTINVYSELGKGTTFKIYLPRYTSTEPLIEAKSSLPAVQTGSETILLVEDEQVILKLIVMMLQKLGYTVICAATPEKAIDIAKNYSGQIHLLLTDVIMPGMNGRDLANQLLQFYPDLTCLFMSGYTANVIAHHGILDEGIHFIAKPFSKKDLSMKVRKALDHN